MDLIPEFCGSGWIALIELVFSSCISAVRSHCICSLMLEYLRRNGQYLGLNSGTFVGFIWCWATFVLGIRTFDVLSKVKILS